MFNLNPNDNRTQVFNYTGSWQTWRKPDNVNIVQITCIGGGGGGGGGRSRGSDVCVGGGGGASSSISISTYIASMLPDTLFILVGSGGTGGIPSTSTGNAGGNGTRSYVSVLPNTSSFNLVCISGGADTGGGVGGITGPGSVAGGVGSAIASETNAVFMGISNFTGFAGQNGGIGDDTTIPPSITGLTSVTCPAPGGGGCGGSSSYDGASVNANGVSPKITGGVATNGLRNGENGVTFFTSKYGFFSTGGASGAGNYGVVGTIAGNGGNGGIGSGGGGGGGGGTGGYGGYGGNGIVIIQYK